MEREPQHHESALDAFRAEIARLKAEETETAHFRDMNPDELHEEDRGIYEAFLGGALSLEAFETYRNGIQEQGSRADFAAYLANKIAIRTMEEYLRQKKNRENPM